MTENMGLQADIAIRNNHFQLYTNLSTIQVRCLIALHLWLCNLYPLLGHLTLMDEMVLIVSLRLVLSLTIFPYFPYLYLIVWRFSL